MITLNEIQQMPNEALTVNYCYEVEIMNPAPERIKRFAENIISKISFNDKLLLEIPILYSENEPEIVAEILRLFMQNPNKFKVTCYTPKHERLFSLIVSVEHPKIIYTFDSEATITNNIQKIQIQYAITNTQVA